MVNIAMIGCGDISGIYLKNLTETFKEVTLIGVCDLIPERAQRAYDRVLEQQKKGFDCVTPKIYKDMYEAFNDPDVDVVLNITRPYQHYEVSKQALLHGKHVFSEKPLAADMEEGDELVSLAEEKGLYMGGAPDTFMGAGIQTCRKLIDDGVIGDPVGATCAMICHGHETWHPDPEFYYKRGGGPMMDMGPYYVTALINLLGPVDGLVARTKKSFDTRLITSKPHYGEIVDVDVDTYLAGTLQFKNGAIGTLFTTFDVHYGPFSSARFEVYGTKGTLIVPDPNTFGGPIYLFRPEDQKPIGSGDPALMEKIKDPFLGYKEVPLMFDYRENSRALGLSDMCKAIETGREARCNYRQQHHVLEILTGFEKSSREGKYIELKTKYERSNPMYNNPMHGILD
ncbi:MAG: Gfo/Idh/MocA family oxidoreductase [Clostridia bacterium]|nr:Gfo/Idh/MocA family oxidoreductase [Clostridia bacterium]